MKKGVPMVLETARRVAPSKPKASRERLSNESLLRDEVARLRADIRDLDTRLEMQTALGNLSEGARERVAEFIAEAELNAVMTEQVAERSLTNAKAADPTGAHVRELARCAEANEAVRGVGILFKIAKSAGRIL